MTCTRPSQSRPEAANRLCRSSPVPATLNPGAPCWAGLRSADVAASTAFYSGLFGWEPLVAPNGYVTYLLGGKAVAGAGPLFDETQRPGWRTYLGVVDVDRTALAAVQAGATILVEPFDVPDTGRVGVVIDPVGAEVWLWQSFGFSGADVTGESGTVCRQELVAGDVAAARAFYDSVLGVETARLCSPGTGEEATVAEWRVAFAVEDVEAAVARACALGASSVGSSPGLAMLADPDGCRFSVCDAGAGVAATDEREL